MQSVFSSPNPILFGIGAAEETGNRLKGFGCTKVLVVYDKGIKSTGIADRIIGIIQAAGLETVSYDGVQADPPDWSVDEAGTLGIKENVNGVVGIGGGSSLDTAKGAKLLLTNPPPVNQYFGREGVVTKPSWPLIVIPTTAGTGSECTPGGVITDTRQNIKTNIAGVGCAVTLGIVDPELTVGLPPAITASTGLDVFGHAFESYTSNLANSLSEVVGREAIRLTGKYLVAAYRDGSNMEAREGMMLAATLGGMSMSGALCHIAHNIGRLLGSKFQIPHGVAGACCLPQVLEAIAPAVPEKVKYITEMIGFPLPADASVDEIKKAAYSAGMKLIHDLDLPNLKSYGLTKESILAVIPNGVMKQSENLIMLFGRSTSPIPESEALIADIISRAYDEN
jgi:alcohol dehydrogenase class IV